MREGFTTNNPLLELKSQQRIVGLLALWLFGSFKSHNRAIPLLALTYSGIGLARTWLAEGLRYRSAILPHIVILQFK